jgi:hypothetical protein
MPSKKKTTSKKPTTSVKKPEQKKPAQRAAQPEELTTGQRVLLNMATARAHNRLFGNEELRQYYPMVRDHITDLATLEFISNAPDKELIPWLKKIAEHQGTAPIDGSTATIK